MSPTAIHPAEIERMRALLAAYDSQTGNGMAGIKEFDLNKPAVEPYAHKEFPLHMTRKSDGKVRIASSKDEADKLQAKGYLLPHEHRAHVASLTPPDDEPEQDPDDDGIALDAAGAAEAAELDAKLKAPKPSKKAKGADKADGDDGK